MNKNEHEPEDSIGTKNSDDPREYHVVVDRIPRLTPNGQPIYDKHGKPVIDVIRNLIGVRLKKRRLECKWTHRDLTSEIKLISGGVWQPKDQETFRIEQQRKFVTDYETKLIASALRCSVAWLIGESNDLPEPYPDGAPRGEMDSPSG